MLQAILLIDPLDDGRMMSCELTVLDSRRHHGLFRIPLQTFEMSSLPLKWRRQPRGHDGEISKKTGG